MPTVNYGRYDDAYSIAPSRKDVYGNPRSSADRVNTAGNVVTTYQIAPDPPSRSSRGHEGSRSRRSTLDSTSKPVIVTSQGSRYPAVHGGDGSSTPLDNPFRASDEGDYYAIPATSGRHRGHYRGSSATMDNADMNRHLHETPEERLLRVGSGRDGTIYPKSRPIYPDTLVRRPDGIAEDYGDNGYGYTNPRDLVTYDLDPRRRPRRDSFESTRSARPVSISGGYPEVARSFDARDRGPPPSTRGFDKIPYDAPGMRMPMPGEALPEPYEPGLTRRDSKSRRPVSVYHDDRRRPPQDDYYGISDDEKGRRKIPAPTVPYDNAVEQRGFGIRLPGMDIHHHHQLDVPEIRTETPPEKVDYDKHDKHDKDIYVDKVDDKRNSYDERSDKKNTKDNTKEALTAGLGVAAAALGLGAAKVVRDDDKDDKETDNYRRVREAGKLKSYDVEDNGERDDYRRRRDHDDEARKRREAHEDRDADAAVVDLTGRDPKERRSREDRDSIDSRESKERAKDEGIPVVDLSRRNAVEKPLVRDDRRDDREEARRERRREGKDRQEAIVETAPEVAERRKDSGDTSPADLTPPDSHQGSPASDESIEHTASRRRARQDAAARFNPKDAVDLRALKDAINNKETAAPPPPIPPKEPLPKESTNERFDPRDARDLASIRAELAKSEAKGEDRGRHSDSDDGLERRRPRLVSPPREDSKKGDERPVKGILRQPRERFPEDPDPIREGVAPLKDAKKDGVPPDARWTKISRKLVNPEALELGKERYEARDDFVVVLRVLSKEEVQGYATVTQQIRG
jgi:hypothetical protein